MADAHTAAAAPSPGHVVVPVWRYVFIFVALLVLTGATVGAAHVDLGLMNNVVALGIALLKASLVVLYFMHVRYSSRLIPLAIFAGLCALLYFITGTLSDYVSRGTLDVPGR